MIRIQNARVDGTFAHLPVDLTTGRTQIGTDILENTIPVPLRHEGAFELRLQAKWEEAGIVTFTGSGAELELLGEPGDIEEFRP